MRLIDADALGNRMHHESFEKDSDLQRWDGGCWIRYKLFEQVLREAPTIDSTHITPSNTLGALDCVERQDAIEAIEKVHWYHQNDNGEMVRGANSHEHQPWYKSQDVYDALEKLPSVQPRRGKWIRTRTMTHDGELYCDQCEQEHPEQKLIWNYCPNCGCRMEEGDSDEKD